MCSRKPLYFEAMFLDPDVGRREHIQCHKKVILTALMGCILMIKFRNPMQPPQITKPSSKLFHAQKHRLPWNQSLTWLPTHTQIHLLLRPSLPTLNFQLSIRFPALTLTFLLLTFTAPPSHFSTLFSFPFSLFSLTLHFLLIHFSLHSNIFLLALTLLSSFLFTQATCPFKNSSSFFFPPLPSPFFRSLLHENLPLH